MNSIGLQDIVLLLIYLPIVLFFLALLFLKSIKGSPGAQFFFPAVLFKLLSGIGIGLLFQYHYGGGDTFSYFESGKLIVNTIFTNFSDGIRMLFYGETLGYDFPNPALAEMHEQFFNYRIAAIANMLSFNTYLVSSLFYSLFAFYGSWKLFRVLCTMYPENLNSIAFALLFIPSVVFWGSGILKDSICIGALGLLVAYGIEWIVFRKFSLYSLIALLVCAYLLNTIKAYIFLSAIAAFGIVLIVRLITLSKSLTIKLMTGVMLLISTGVAWALFGEALNEQLVDIIKESFLENALLYSSAVKEISEDPGSTYELISDISNINILTILKLTPAAINVTFFRPYPWEAGKLIQMISALESFLLLLFSIWVIIRVGPLKLIGSIFNDRVLLFMLLFAIIFSVAIGIASGNFGALSRYRIPCIPLLIIPLLIILSRKKEPLSPEKI